MEMFMQCIENQTGDGGKTPKGEPQEILENLKLERYFCPKYSPKAGISVIVFY
jgi:hypothetical protein